jgi:hypothetical protein
MPTAAIPQKLFVADATNNLGIYESYKASMLECIRLGAILR